MFISEVFKGAPEEKRGDLENKTYAALGKLGIEFTRVDNDPVDAMEDCVPISEKLGAEIRKTIVLCNRKKTSFYLLVLPADKGFDTRTFCDKVGCSRVSFAPPESMEKVLGVTPGNASVMSILNDEDDDVQVVIDKEVADAEWFACNTGTHTTHIRMKTADLINTFLPKNYHRPIIVAL